MSIKLITMVWDRYPRDASANELLLALALADFAHDDGTSIWPSNTVQAEKIRAGESTAKRLRTTMMARGWLELVRRASGRKGDTNEYRISAAWIAGGELAKPGLNLSPPEDGAAPVDNPALGAETRSQIEQDQVSNPTRPGLTAVTPESPGTVKEPKPPTPVDNPAVDNSAGPASRPEDRCPEGGEGRPPWRWTRRRRDVERQAARVGIERWDENAFARGAGEAFSAYRARVQAAIRTAVAARPEHRGGDP